MVLGAPGKPGAPVLLLVVGVSRAEQGSVTLQRHLVVDKIVMEIILTLWIVALKTALQVRCHFFDGDFEAFSLLTSWI